MNAAETIVQMLEAGDYHSAISEMNQELKTRVGSLVESHEVNVLTSFGVIEMVEPEDEPDDETEDEDEDDEESDDDESKEPTSSKE